MRRIHLWCLWLALPSAVACAQDALRAEQEFANYAFAHELGSGLYESNGRLLQIYRLPFAWRYREASPAAPGVTLLLPTTLGFFDFSPQDAIANGLPDGIDSISFVPGIGLEFLYGGRWRLMPYAKFGVEIADQSDVSDTLYSVGINNEYSWSRAGGWRGRFRDDLIYSGVNYRGELPSDAFVRWRNAVEVAQGLNARIGGYELEGGLFAMLDWFVDPPTGPVTGIDIPDLQIEAGVMLGTRPALKWRRVPIPRIGLSYRYAGDISAWRLVLGVPF